MKIFFLTLALLAWPIGSDAHVIEHTHDTPTTPTPTGACEVTASRVGSARIEFHKKCGTIKPDCDPVPRGSWTCSSVQIGSGAPSGVGKPNSPVQDNPDPNPVPDPPNVPSGIIETSIGGTYTGPGPGGVSWMDSFQRDGKCWIDSNFDHGIGNVMVDTPDGRRTVRQVADAQDAPSRRSSDPIYNDVQCGHGPANNAGDEDQDQCPGRVDQGKAGCRKIGPKWHFASAPVTPPTPSESNLRREAESASLRGGWVRSPDGIVWNGPNRYNINSRQDSANISYQIVVTEAGEYEFEMRLRPLVGTTPSEPPNDVWFKFGSTGWIKAYVSKSRAGWFENVTGEHNGARNKQLLRSNLAVGTHELLLSGRSNGSEIDWVGVKRVGGSVPTPAPDTKIGFYEDGDLLSVHWDSCPDYDDLQAMIATREVLDEYPTIDFEVTNGTKKRQGCNFVNGSSELMRMMFPSGLDAHASLATTVQTRATSWQLTLSSGNTVHVAEGGPSDFTADVVRELENRGVTNLKNIRIVQHSTGWNENNTIPANISYLVNKTTYIRIQDGNNNNNTPDYNLQGGTFEARARASRYGQEWAIAFSKANAARKVDFSDTVEVMYILGIPKSAAPNPAAFANRYF